MVDTARPSAKAAGASLWRTDGARYSRSDAWASARGGLRITHHDMGAAEYAAWGEDDNELSLELTPSEAAKLATVLLRDRFGGRSDAFEAIRAYCEEHDVEATLSQWT
jgi:hypothetical protein